MLNLLLALIVVDIFVLDLVTPAMSICDDVVCCGISKNAFSTGSCRHERILPE